MIYAVAWKDDALELLDQTLLPEETRFLRLTTIEQAYEAIKALRVRGAPAIGITAAYGLYLGIRNEPAKTPAAFFQALDEKIQYLSAARPTAVNLAWALQEIKKKLQSMKNAEVADLKSAVLREATALHEDDRQRCNNIGSHGQELVPKNARILTHCNTGALATGGIGTALGVIHRAHLDGKAIQVYANETRPVLQGARLTMFELTAANIPSHLLCDSAAAYLMQKKNVDLVIVGADRIAADGSTANKIGTYGLAVSAKHHGVPFYIAAPISTFDLSIASGAEIPIEDRDENEVRRIFNKALITTPDARCLNPAFDVTPPELITAFVTERGIIRPPFLQNIRAVIGNS